MNKGFYPLNGAAACNTTYWQSAAEPRWEAIGWKREIDDSFSRAQVCKRASAPSNVPEPLLLSGFSLFDEGDVKRSQNCAIVGRRVVSRLSFDKSMVFDDIIDLMMDGLCDSEGDMPSVILDLFSNAFEVDGIRDSRVDAMFRHLRNRDQEDVRVNMKTHEYLLYQIRIEHETCDVKRQLECLKNAHSLIFAEAPLHLAEAERIYSAFEHTTQRVVRDVVAAMRQMAAYYLHG